MQQSKSMKTAKNIEIVICFEYLTFSSESVITYEWMTTKNLRKCYCC